MLARLPPGKRRPEAFCPQTELRTHPTRSGKALSSKGQKPPPGGFRQIYPSLGRVLRGFVGLNGWCGAAVFVNPRREQPLDLCGHALRQAYGAFAIRLAAM